MILATFAYIASDPPVTHFPPQTLYFHPHMVGLHCMESPAFSTANLDITAFV